MSNVCRRITLHRSLHSHGARHAACETRPPSAVARAGNRQNLMYNAEARERDMGVQVTSGHVTFPRLRVVHEVDGSDKLCV